MTKIVKKGPFEIGSPIVETIVENGLIKNIPNPSVVELGKVATDVVNSWIDYKKVCQEEKTKRLAITEGAKTYREEINANKEIFMKMIDETYAERKNNYQELFKRFDEAMANNNIELAEFAMTGIIAQIKKSPFADMVSFKKNFDDKSQIEEI